MAPPGATPMARARARSASLGYETRMERWNLLPGFREFEDVPAFGCLAVPLFDLLAARRAAEGDFVGPQDHAAAEKVHAPLALENQDLVHLEGAEHLGAHFGARLARVDGARGQRHDAQQTKQQGSRHKWLPNSMTYNLVAQPGTEIKINRAPAPFFQCPVIPGPSFRRCRTRLTLDRGAAVPAIGFMNSSLPAVPDVGLSIKTWI